MSKEITLEKEQELTPEQKAEKKLIEKKKKNIKLYPKYRMFSWDLLFYYSIIYLFLTIEKGITPAQALQFDAFYILFRFFTQIPCTILIQKIGKRKSLITANLLCVLHVIVIILSQNYIQLLLSQLLCSFTFNIKTTCESDMLYDSLEHGEERGSKFAKIDGRATSLYYYIDALSAILAGFLFVVNAYIPMLLCLGVTITSFIMSTKFEDVQGERESTSTKKEIKKLGISLKKVLRSKRLVSLLFFNVLFVSMLRITQTMRNTILKDIGMPSQYFGIIFAALGIISGIAAKNQGRIHKKFRNKTLAFLGIPMAVSILFLGLLRFININTTTVTVIVLLLFIVQYVMKGPYYVLIKRYLNNFTDSQKRIKISTANNLFENLIVSIILFAVAAILEQVDTSYTLILVGCLSVMGVTLLLDYMRGRVGLKKEEYDKKELI